MLAVAVLVQPHEVPEFRRAAEAEILNDVTLALREVERRSIRRTDAVRIERLRRVTGRVRHRDAVSIARTVDGQAREEVLAIRIGGRCERDIVAAAERAIGAAPE